MLSPLWRQTKITFSSRSDIVLGNIHKSLTILLQLPQFTVTVLHHPAINRVASPGICLSYVLQQWERHRQRAIEPHIRRHNLRSDFDCTIMRFFLAQTTGEECSGKSEYRFVHLKATFKTYLSAGYRQGIRKRVYKWGLTTRSLQITNT